MKPLKLVAVIVSCAVVVSITAYSVINGVARMRSAVAMAESANKFLASLDAGQKSKASFSFDDEQRYDWHFVPRARKGIPLKELNQDQRKLAMEFMKTGLGAAGYQKATTIISLEPILAELEGTNRRFPRDPELYYFSIFGTPSPKSVWGWRVEGHHISLNFTVIKGELISNTPLFFGANPAEVRQGERKGLRALAGEEDRARELVVALDEKQRAIALFDKTAPGDILSTNKRKADPLKPEGIAASELNKQQKELLTKLIDEYLARMPQDVAAERLKKLKDAGIDKIYFAWAGGINKGEPHYYRVQGTTFLIEYDDTQNNANHIHSVWRDFNGDFGADLLREHYQSTPHKVTQQSTSPNEVQQPAPQKAQVVDSVTMADKSVEPMTASLRPTILYVEKVRYTDEAINARIQGDVMLSIVFGADGKISNVRVIRGLPYGLTEKAIEAAYKIRFRPAIRDGKPISVRGDLEFSFSL